MTTRSAVLEQETQARTERRIRRRFISRGTQAAMQRGGMSRREARRVAFGDTRRDATSHLTRGQALNERVRVNAAAKRRRRCLQVAASIAVAEASW